MSIGTEAPGAVKNEPLSDDEELCEEPSEGEALLDLYKDHQIKEELVVGPEVVTRPPEAAAVDGDTEHASLMQPNLMVRLPRLTATALRNYKQAPDYTDSDEFSSDSEITLLRIKQEKLSSRSKRTIKLSSETKQNKYALGDTEYASLMQPNLMVRLPRLTAAALRNYTQARGYSDSDEFSLDSEIPLFRIKQEKLSSRSKRTIKLSRRSKQPIKLSSRSKQPIKLGKKKYSCPYCKEAFPNKKTLLKHEQKHANTKGKKYECEICEKKFKSSDYVRKHIKRMHMKPKIYNCKVCIAQFTSTRDLADHMLIHADLKPFECDLCHRKFWIKGFLAHHINSTHKVWKCEICQREFQVKWRLINHLRCHVATDPDAPQIIQYKQKIQEDEKRLTCGVCQKTFTQQSNLGVHLRLHTGEKRYQCQHCAKKFSTKHALVCHASNHTGIKPYRCDICYREFATLGVYNAHRKLHTTEPAYACEVCDKKFFKRSRWLEHSLVHSTEKLLKCDMCDKQFKSRTALTKHKEEHSGKRYTCKYCEKRFNSKIKWKNHLEKHTADWYECEVCEKTYTLKRNWAEHRRIVHNLK